MLNYNTLSFSSVKKKFALKYFVLFFLCFKIFSADKAAAQWVWQNPLPQGTSLKSISALNASNIIAAGDAGATVWSSDGGETWGNSVFGSYHQFTFSSVDYISPNTAFAAGADFFSGVLGIYKTTNAGNTWFEAYLATNTVFYTIDFIDANTGYAIGGSNDGGGFSGAIHKTTDGGNSWTPQANDITGQLFTAHFIDANNGTAAGEQGRITRTTNGGINWVQQVSGSIEDIRGVFFSDANTGTVVTFFGEIFRTTNGGANWVSQVSGTANPLYAVSFIDANSGTIAGEGITLRTTDGGANWTPNFDVPRTLYSVTFVDANTGYASGYGGSIYKTTNGGENWILKTGQLITELRSVYFVDKNTGIVVGAGGTILKTTNAGQNWTSRTSGTAVTLNGVFFIGKNNGFAVGATGTILKTTNGGDDWFAQTSGVTQSLNKVFFTDANTGTVVGQTGRILRTTNGGIDWSAQTSGVTQALNKIFLIDANTGIAGGASGRILRTTNGGTNWSAVQNGSASYNGIFFADANTGWLAGASGRILKTTNAGVNWTQQSSSTTLSLQSVFFTDLNNGIATGFNGLVLRTTNGGTNWASENAGVFQPIFDIFRNDANTATIVGAAGAILRYGASAGNSNYGNNNQTGNNLYYFANSLPGGSGSPSQPEFIWRDTTGSLSLYADGANQAAGIFSGTDDNGRWGLISQLGTNNIRFFGSNYTDVYIGTNGVIGFNAFNTDATQPPLGGLNQSSITEAIFPLWMDLNLSYAGVTGRRVSYKVTADELMVTYSRVPVYSTSLTNDPERYVSFQVIIKLSSGSPENSIIFISYYYDETGSVFRSEYNDATLRTHLVGLQRSNNTQEFFQYRYGNNLTLAANGPLFGSNMTIATGPDNANLPVELSSFTASIDERDVTLNWSTISESNNAGYEIERLNQASNQWSKIAFIEGNGTTNETNNYSFSDRGLNTGKYNYRLKQIDYNGNFEYFNLAGEIFIGIPAKYKLSQNYPNPFNPVTKISFDIPVSGKVTIKVFDVMGREVAALINEIREAGYHTVTFDAKNIASGIYFYKLTAGDASQQFISTKKMVLVK